MPSFCSFCLSFAVFLCVIIVGNAQQLQQVDLDALTDLMTAMPELADRWQGGPNCSSNGIRCNNNDPQRVDSLLISNVSSGSIPDSIQKLEALTSLSIHSVPLPGKLTSAIQKLTNLVELSIVGCLQVSDTFPSWITSLSQLRVLDLSSNQLIGELPSDLGNLQGMNSMLLHNNMLNGSLPDLSPMKMLITLWLQNNTFSGNLPDGIGGCTELKQLLLDDNGFSGFLPPTIANLTNLQILRIQGNKFKGRFPDLTNLSQLISLDASLNMFRGALPDLSSCTKLDSLNLISNSFQGEVPAYLATLPLDSCLLSGNLFKSCNVSLVPNCCTTYTPGVSSALSTTGEEDQDTTSLAISSSSSTSLMTSSSMTTTSSTTITSSTTTSSGCKAYECTCSSNLTSISLSQVACNSGVWIISGSPNNTGTIVVGESDHITVNGSFTQSSSGNLVVHSNGTSVPTKIDVVGDVSIQGELTIILTKPLEGSNVTLTVLRASSVTGNFSAVHIINNYKYKCKPHARTVYGSTDISVIFTQPKCNNDDTKTIAIAVACSVGGFIIIAAILIIILVQFQRRGKFVGLFYAGQSEQELALS